MGFSNTSKSDREQLSLAIAELKDYINTVTNNESDRAVQVGRLDSLELAIKKFRYGLSYEKHIEQVDIDAQTKIPVFIEDKSKEVFCDAMKKYNFLLEGDNLLSLKILQKTHLGKVDVIYIDPPYNTLKNDFVYGDRMVDQNDGYKHSKWLSFMSSRLEIARTLLKDEGIIYISIDEHEFAQLKMLCDSIFHEDNFVENFIWIKNSTKNNSKTTSTNHEYILCYARDIEKIKALDGYFRVKKEGYSDVFDFISQEKNSGTSINLIEKKLNALYKRNPWWKGVSMYKHIDENHNVYRTSDISAPGGNGRRYEVIHPVTLKPVKIPTGGWRYSEEKMKELIKECRIEFGDDEKTIPQYKRFLKDVETDVLKSIIEDNLDGKKELMNLFGGTSPFDNPKPTTLIKKLLSVVPNKDAIVLDFFAGSGTTGHSVLELNNEDGGNRSFILCTNNENNICEDVTYARLSKIINGFSSANGKDVPGIPSNLKYYKAELIDKVSPEEEEEMIENLAEYIQALVQLENAIAIPNSEIRIIFDDEDADELERDIRGGQPIKKIYMDTDVLLTGQQKKLLEERGIETSIIPTYYFKEEIVC